jgi:hypothetical protein
LFLSQESYTASEANETVTVCFIVSGEFERNITVQISTASMSAVDGLDYVGVSQDVSFQALDTHCVDVALVRDSLLEEEEDFEFNLSSNDSAVNFTLSRAEVVILDANRE